MESTSYVFSFRNGVFLPCDPGVCDDSINQSVKVHAGTKWRRNIICAFLICLNIKGLSGGCKAGLSLKEKDSFLLLPRPWSRCSGRDGSAQ